MLASQELGDVGVIAVGVALGHQGSDLLAQIIGEGPGCGPVAVAVDERRGAVLLIGGFEAPDLAFGHAEQRGGFGVPCSGRRQGD